MKGSPRGGRAVRPDLVDAVVLEAYGLVREEGWLADRALERVLRRERRLYAAERRAAAEAVYGILRAQGQLAWLLGEGARRGPRCDPATLYAAWMARSGALAPDAAARRVGLDPKLLGAALDRADERIAAIDDPALRLAVEVALPRWLAARLLDDLGPEEALALGRAMNVRAPLTVRTNALRGTRDALRERLREEGTRADPGRWTPWALHLDGHANAFALEAFSEGWFEIQDEGSQLIALAVGARSGQKVVDACAGAGGKALALAAEMHGKGELWALDVAADRLEEARRRARRAGVHNLRDRVLPPGAEADAALSDLNGRCDRVLVDAPCSGLGTLRRKPDARWRLDPGDPARFAALQRELLVRFARLVKPGGRLVYATCAVGRTENEDVVAAAAPELPELAPLPLASALGAELATAIGVAPGAASVHLLPHRHGTDGFFLATFERRAV